MAAKIAEIFLNISTGLLVCATIAKSGIFKAANIEVGFHQYAEIVDLTTILKMPLNALVNIGYVLVGIYWIAKLQNGGDYLSKNDIYFFHVFSLMSICYAPIQFFRIITQNHFFAVLDQWVTLPIFAWASVWGMHIQNPSRYNGLEMALLIPSVLSYFLITTSSIGFEIALGLHIIWTIIVAVSCQCSHGNSTSLIYMLLAIFSCTGFVALKINDIKLGKVHWIFKKVSGHFLSKICDIIQIDLVSRFFLEIMQSKTYSKTKSG